MQGLVLFEDSLTSSHTPSKKQELRMTDIMFHWSGVRADADSLSYPNGISFLHSHAFYSH